MPRAHSASRFLGLSLSPTLAFRTLSRPIGITVVSVLAILASSAPAAADDVFLRNGQVFEGVIAERSGDSVRIRLEFGEIRLSADQVLRIEQESSAVHEYVQQRQALAASTDSGAAEWLALADWARSKDLQHGEREALLRAGEIDPRRPELAPRLRGIGLEFDERTESWIPFDQHMRGRGYVRVAGEWISRQELAQLRDQQREAAAERRAAADSRALRDATVLLFAEAEATRQEVRAQRQGAGTTILSLGSGGAVVGFTARPGFAIPPGYDGNSWSGTPVQGPLSRDNRDDSRGYGVLIGRPPGSLISNGSNSSSFSPAPRSGRRSGHRAARGRSSSGRRGGG